MARAVNDTVAAEMPEGEEESDDDGDDGSNTYGLDRPPFAAVLAAVEAQTQLSPGNLSASGASFLRGVGDLNP